MTIGQIFLNNAEERLHTLRPAHYRNLLAVLEGLPSWNEAAFYQALNALGWTEKRVPLNILEAEREDWEQKYSSPPYVQPCPKPFSSPWLQEVKTAFFLYAQNIGLFKGQTGRFTYAGKKGMGLALAFEAPLGYTLRLLYTDLPLLYDMNKIGVGFLLASSKNEAGLREALQKQRPCTNLPLVILSLS